MSRSCIVMGLFTWLALAAAACGQRTPLIELLPRSTLAVAHVPDYSDLRSRLAQTALGRLGRDERVADFAGTLATAVLDFQFPASAVARRRGEQGEAVLWRDLPGGSFGEVVFAVVARPDDEPVWLVLVDAGAHLGIVRPLLHAELARAERGGGQRSVESIGEGTLTVVSRAGSGWPLTCAAVRDEVCGWCDDPQVLRSVLRAWDGREKTTLASNPRYRRWRAWRASPASAGAASNLEASVGRRPDVELFVDLAALLPAGAGESREVLGGQISIGKPPYDLLVEAELLLDTPRSGPARLLTLGGDDTTAQAWIPREAATYATLHWNIAQARMELARLQGQQPQAGRLAGQLAAESGWELPTGAAAIAPDLAGRFSHVKWFTSGPDNTLAELWAASVRRPGDLAPRLGELAALFGQNVREASYQGQSYFEFAAGDLASEAAPPKCLCLLGESLILANQPAALHRAIDAARNPGERLAEALDYKLAQSKIHRLSGSRSPAGAHFVRPGEFVRHWYELATAQLSREHLQEMARASPLHRILLRAVESSPPPPFEALDRLLAPGGGVLVDDGEAVRYTFFLMRRK